MGEISKHLEKGRFIKVRKGDKKPHGDGDWNDKTLTYQEANEWLAGGHNVGLVAGEGIIIIDADKNQND